MLRIVHQIILLLIIGATVNSASAEIYRWVDDRGTVYYTDKPLDKNNPEKITLQINSFSSPSVTPYIYGSSLISKRRGASNVVMYSTTWCG